MINSPIYIFDGIGSRFSILDGHFLIGQPLTGYNALSKSHVGSYIPYLARSGSEWEIGIGYIKNVKEKIVVERNQIVKSSNNNNLVEFYSDDNQFYIFANESGFSTGFNNVLVRTQDFNIEPIQSTYLIDSTSGSINCKLPSLLLSKNLVLEFKLLAGSEPVYIRNSNDKIFTILNNVDSYIKIVSDGTRWVGLNNDAVDISLQSLSDNTNFSALSNPSGDILSLQYNSDGTNFSGGQIYYGSGNKLLFGDDVEVTAHHIIPSSGNGNVIFNNDNTNTNFIIEGSGTRNLFFDYRGRLGLNIPSGSSPDTILHIINSTCKEGIRLENRTTCHPTNITLYYKPSSPIISNTTIAEINLAAKNSLGNQTDYASIEAKALDATAGTSKGQLSIGVATSNVAGTGINTIVTNPDYTYVGYSGNNLTITNNSTSKLGYSNSYISASNSAVTVQAPTINLNSSNIVLGTGTSTNVNVPSLYASYIQSNTLRVQNIAPSSILTINSSGNIAAGQSVVLPIPENRILTTTSGGAITGIYTIDDYFLTNEDINWNYYPSRSGTVAIRQMVFSDPVNIQEFVVGDQVEITINNIKYYRNIENIDIVNNNIVGLLLNQNITSNTTTLGSVKSITRGGYFSIDKKIEEGIVSDATSNILSIRPNTDTVFNSNKKDINFNVYGVDEVPALSIKANSGRSNIPSGFFHNFAPQKPQCTDCIAAYSPDNDIEPFPIVINAGGSGLSTLHSSANFNSIGSGNFSGIVTTVGTNGISSYYGTYDQNGNAAEWIEDNTVSSTSPSQFVAGGSWKTTIDTDGIGASGLKSIESLTRVSGYDYVGFRVASQYNLVDTNSISSVLDLELVSISNPSNLPDNGTLYLYEDSQYLPVELPNLGVVNKNYRIGKYEITNEQYALFLNTVATDNDRNLFDSRMSSAAMGGITRVGDGSLSPYEYSIKNNMENKPVLFVSYLSAIRFINWLHHGAPLSGITDIDTILDFGAYDIFPIGEGSYLINKNIYQKYWLPSLNEWHKAAYFEPRAGLISSGSSAVMVKRDEPYTVTDTTETPILANLSVSGWLYVDHLIVGDNIGVSSSIPRRTLPTTGGGGGIDLNDFVCNTSSDCESCEVCRDGLCQPSTDICCVGDCCKPDSWDPVQEICNFCELCSDSTNDNPLPCELFGGC
jgi:hypothetical protein